MASENNNSKQQLQQILTSDDYSIREEVQKPKLTEDADLSWLGEILRWLFENQGSSSSDWILIISAILKGLLILALLWAIYWLIKNADRIKGWINQRQWNKNNKKVIVQDYQQAHLSQGWENLPNHQDIPEVVTQLVNDNKILPAMSILYRASLRWLNESELLKIVPVNTEMQCMQSIHNIQRVNQIDSDSAQYIIDIISYWIPVAYSGSNKFESIEPKIIAISKDWQTKLPIIKRT